MNSNKYIQIKNFFALLLLIVSSSAAFAHSTVIDIEKMSGTDTAALYLILGFTHILPFGLDHILFVLGLFFFNPQFKPVLKQVTIFTLAHTLTLALSVYKIINLPSSIVEPLIALSIVFVAIENIFIDKLRNSRLLLVFLFGLIHGMGFASALAETGLPQNRFFSALLLFNIGVELGQITVILIAWFVLVKWVSKKTYYRKYILTPISILIGIIALYWMFTRINFSENRKPLVNNEWIVQAMQQYSDSTIIKNEADLLFWKNRIVPGKADYTNSLQYASALSYQFHLNGNIAALQQSDSVLLSVISNFKETEAAPFLALSRQAILQHEFKKADSLIFIAQKIGLKKYEAAAAGFDVSFELGNIQNAAVMLKNIQMNNDFGYQFRCSKLMHYYGNLDSSISAMKTAFKLAGENNYLKQAALSNLGDLYVHDNNLEAATDCYKKSIETFRTDLHSLIGLGWVALMHDGNDSLAEKIFRFVTYKKNSPEAFFKLISVAQQRKDTALEIQFAHQFVQKVSDYGYGNMYNKYLLQLYTGVLNNPSKALHISSIEIQNRNTAQTQAWHSWALFKTNKKGEAMDVFTKNVSGKPLEALELYWMGKLLMNVGKTSLALQYLNEAYKSKYDLSPAIIDDLKILLQQ